MGEQPDSETVIDLDEALAFTAGDREMLIEMGGLFLQEGPRQLQDVHTAVEAADATAIREAAHTLKGSVVIFGAGNAEAAALAVQLAADDGDLSRVDEAYATLNREMERLMREVEKLCNG